MFWISFLNDCFSLTDSCIKKYGGTLDKFIGDCTMAFWGAPLPCEDSSYLACCAAEDILINLPKISSKHHFSGYFSWFFPFERKKLRA